MIQKCMQHCNYNVVPGEASNSNLKHPGVYMKDNEETFSQQCWPVIGVHFTPIGSYTSEQSQTLMNAFTRSGNVLLPSSDNSLLQRNSFSV